MTNRATLMFSHGCLMTLCFVIGACLGTFFFGGLHYTVVKGLGSPQPALWFFGSFMLRSAVVVGGFTLLAQRDPLLLLAALLGFLIARQVTLKLTSQRSAPWENSNAS